MSQACKDNKRMGKEDVEERGGEEGEGEVERERERWRERERQGFIIPNRGLF